MNKLRASSLGVVMAGLLGSACSAQGSSQRTADTGGSPSAGHGGGGAGSTQAGAGGTFPSTGGRATGGTNTAGAPATGGKTAGGTATGGGPATGGKAPATGGSAPAGGTGGQSTCQCTGTDQNGAPVTVSCGQSTCGSGNVRYDCSATGWTNTGVAC
jgi:hypothetical protein